MPQQELVFDDPKHLLGGAIVLSLHYYVYADIKKLQDPNNLKEAFSCQIDMRLFGIDIASTDRCPIAEAARLRMYWKIASSRTPFKFKGQPLESEVKGWQAFEQEQPTQRWSHADDLQFHIPTSTTDTTLTVDDLVNAISGLDILPAMSVAVQGLLRILRGVLQIVPGAKHWVIPVSLSHSTISLSIRRTPPNKQIVGINNHLFSAKARTISEEAVKEEAETHTHT